MSTDYKSSMALWGISVSFLILACCFSLDLWGRPKPLVSIPLVDPSFLDTNTVRNSYNQLFEKEEDTSGFQCYACHEEGKALPLTFDADQNIILPEDHEDIKMGHGSHNRNNNCYNCHNETNLESLQTREGKPIDFSESPRLCGSCHGPTYADWEAGAHGRISGSWTREEGTYWRAACTDCHNPHAPPFPSLEPAPGPHPLHANMNRSNASETEHE